MVIRQGGLGGTLNFDNTGTQFELDDSFHNTSFI